MPRKLQALLYAAFLLCSSAACDDRTSGPEGSSSSNWLTCLTDVDCNNLPVTATCGGEGYCVDSSGVKVEQSVTLDADFSGDALDPAVFAFETGFALRNGDVQAYTDRAENAFLEDGELVLVARAETLDEAEYTSASIETKGKQSFLYGRIEAELKAPAGPGVDPSFWMLPEKPGAAERSCDGGNCSNGVWPVWGDVVIASLRTETNAVLSGVNYATPGTPDLLQAHDVTKQTYAPTADDYHAYRLDWGPERMDWFVDGVPVKSVDLTDAAIYHPDGENPFQRAFHLKLSLGVGGLSGTAVPGDFPQEMRIRRLRVSQYQ